MSPSLAPMEGAWPAHTTISGLQNHEIIHSSLSHSVCEALLQQSWETNEDRDGTGSFTPHFFILIEPLLCDLLEGRAFRRQEMSSRGETRASSVILRIPEK